MSRNEKNRERKIRNGLASALINKQNKNKWYRCFVDFHRKEAKVVDLTYECLEQMDNLILQSSRGIHLLFEKQDIITALNDGQKQIDEHDIAKLKKIQEVLYKFISLRLYDEKKDFLKTLSKQEQSLLIRAYFKIVENSMITKDKVRH